MIGIRLFGLILVMSGLLSWCVIALHVARSRYRMRMRKQEGEAMMLRVLNASTWRDRC